MQDDVSEFFQLLFLANQAAERLSKGDLEAAASLAEAVDLLGQLVRQAAIKTP